MTQSKIVILSPDQLANPLTIMSMSRTIINNGISDIIIDD